MGSFDAPRAAARAEGFMLLTIDNCKLISSTGDPPDRTGLLEVICVTLPADALFSNPSSPVASPTTSPRPEAERDVWLVLRVGGYEIPLAPTQTIMQSRSKGTFTIVNNPGEKPKSLTIVVPSFKENPRLKHLIEDVETLEILLSQYGILQEIDRDEYGSDGDLKGRLVLVDQNDGQYVGWLGGDLNVSEDPAVEQSGKEPVVVEISEDGQRLNVLPVGPDDKDLLLRSAGLISRGIVGLGDLVTSGFNMASNMYISHTAPNAEPIVFSESTRLNVRRIHTISGQAVTITAKTTGLIHNLIDKMATKVGGGPTPSATASGKPGEKSGTGVGTGTGEEKPQKRKFLNRLLLSTDMIITAVEQSATTMIKGGSKSVSAGVRHKYGEDAGEAAENVGRTVHNCSLIYVDARGVGRRALVKRMGKGVFKARLGKRDVVIGDDLAQQDSSIPPPGARISGPNGQGLKPNPPALPPRSISPSPSQSPFLSAPSGAQAPPPYTPSPSNSVRSRSPAPPLPPRNTLNSAR